MLSIIKISVVGKFVRCSDNASGLEMRLKTQHITTVFLYFCLIKIFDFRIHIFENLIDSIFITHKDGIRFPLAELHFAL